MESKLSFFKLSLFVFLGGGFGAVSRFLLSTVLSKIGLVSWVSVFTVNLIGSLFFIYFMFFTDIKENQLLYPFIQIGFLGALTTYSSLNFEFLSLLQQDKQLEFFGVFALNFGFILISSVLVLKFYRG